MYSHGQIALATARAITGHTCTSKSTDYCPNCTWKCMINYTNTVESDNYSGQLINSWKLPLPKGIEITINKFKQHTTNTALDLYCVRQDNESHLYS